VEKASLEATPRGPVGKWLWLMTQKFLAAALLAWIGNPVLWAAGPLVTSGGFARNPSGTMPSEFGILTYNLHGPPKNRMDDLVEALMSDRVLKEAAILGLQEVDRRHRKTSHKDVASELASVLGMYYAFAVENPYRKGGGERGLAILSRFPMSQVERIALPHAGPGGRRRIALGATLHLGPNRLRVYSIHLETRVANSKHADQLTTVLTDAERYRKLPTVILGDFNTICFRRKKTFALLRASDFQTKPYEGVSFQRLLLLRRKLDWIWARNLEILESGVQQKVAASDHRPVWAQLCWRSQPKETSALLATKKSCSLWLSSSSELKGCEE
jgi:endonuclease/exonuclease/phosphatase family metal-dependent hydrolase